MRSDRETFSHLLLIILLIESAIRSYGELFKDEEFNPASLKEIDKRILVTYV